VPRLLLKFGGDVTEGDGVVAGRWHLKEAGHAGDVDYRELGGHLGERFVPVSIAR